ncbi:hypothetical protein HPP92_026998 [Vanilla planifolia]|uniref:Uncharacterized protein n=1 Tax=Vanilla planifolia TaxID=51239 RepID=A0A835U720_VANPL|nr:hypothetical protein HPP92_026998 [Vanilla planifolia]
MHPQSPIIPLPPPPPPPAFPSTSPWIGSRGLSMSPGCGRRGQTEGVVGGR